MSDATANPVADRKATARAVIASVIGNAFEWFDFLIYGFFATLIAQTFFPPQDAFVTGLLATATFAISSVVRPFGGVVLGLYADRVGRKPALTLIILMMGVATLVIGLAPSYATIGIAAPIIVILARLLQGLSTGGEFASATAMLVEYAPERQRMLFGSLQMCSQALAISVAATFGYVLSKELSHEDLATWGWRVPFLLGVLIVPVGIYFRRKVSESPLFEKNTATAVTFRALMSRHMRAMVAGLGVVVVGTVSNYLWFIYMPMFVVNQLGLPLADALFGTLVCGAILFFLCPLTGMLADRFGARRIFVIGTVAFGLLSIPMFAWVLADPTMTRLLMAQVMIAFVISLIWGPTPGLLGSLFPTGVRSTGMAMSYNMGVLVFGGLAPLTLTTLVNVTGSRMVPAYYILLSAVIALVTLGWGSRGLRHVADKVDGAQPGTG